MSPHHAYTRAHSSPMMFCRTCRRALNTLTGPAGVTYRHTIGIHGEVGSHRPDPAPVAEIDDPIHLCDFCSAPCGVWVYECADQLTGGRAVTSRTFSVTEYQRRHHAARTRRVETVDITPHVWGERWTACDGCAERIEARDLYGLISRVTDAMPAKATRGRRLATVRGLLHQNYSDLLDTLEPGRGRITREHPAGLWQTDVPNPTTNTPREKS